MIDNVKNKPNEIAKEIFVPTQDVCNHSEINYCDIVVIEDDYDFDNMMEEYSYEDGNSDMPLLCRECGCGNYPECQLGCPYFDD